MQLDPLFRSSSINLFSRLEEEEEEAMTKIKLQGSYRGYYLNCASRDGVMEIESLIDRVQ